MAAARMLRSSVAGLALRRSASLSLPARIHLRPASAVSFSSNTNTAGGWFEKRHTDEKDEKYKKYEKDKKSAATGYGYQKQSTDSSWWFGPRWYDDGSPIRSTTDYSSYTSKSDVSSPLSGREDSSSGGGGFWGSWGSADSSSSGGGGGGSFWGGGDSSWGGGDGGWGGGGGGGGWGGGDD